MSPEAAAEVPSGAPCARPARLDHPSRRPPGRLSPRRSGFLDHQPAPDLLGAGCPTTSRERR